MLNRVRKLEHRVSQHDNWIKKADKALVTKGILPRRTAFKSLKLVAKKGKR